MRPTIPTSSCKDKFWMTNGVHGIQKTLTELKTENNLPEGNVQKGKWKSNRF